MAVCLPRWALLRRFPWRPASLRRTELSGWGFCAESEEGFVSGFQVAVGTHLLGSPQKAGLSVWSTLSLPQPVGYRLQCCHGYWLLVGVLFPGSCHALVSACCST